MRCRATSGEIFTVLSLCIEDRSTEIKRGDCIVLFLACDDACFYFRCPVMLVVFRSSVLLHLLSKFRHLPAPLQSRGSVKLRPRSTWWKIWDTFFWTESHSFSQLGFFFPFQSTSYQKTWDAPCVCGYFEIPLRELLASPKKGLHAANKWFHPCNLLHFPLSL